MMHPAVPLGRDLARFGELRICHPARRYAERSNAALLYVVAVAEIILSDGKELHFDVIYPMLGESPRAGLATQLGARCNKDGKLIVDRHQRTTVPALYAAGDVVDELNQISVAMGHAAVAATDIHNRLGRSLSEHCN